MRDDNKHLKVNDDKPVNGIGPGTTKGARKLAEERAEKLSREAKKRK